jgi:hypothetical protein
MDLTARVGRESGRFLSGYTHDEGQLQSLSAVPKPGTALLMGLGLSMLAGSGRRRGRAAARRTGS